MWRSSEEADQQTFLMCSSMLMSSLMQKPRFLAEEEKCISEPQAEMVVGLETEKDLEDERRRRASVLSLLSLSLFSSIQVLMSDRQVSREDMAD